LWVIFALLDPDPDPATQINADLCGSGSGYGSGSETLLKRKVFFNKNENAKKSNVYNLQPIINITIYAACSVQEYTLV
jgi:hypothetical protein